MWTRIVRTIAIAAAIATACVGGAFAGKRDDTFRFGLTSTLDVIDPYNTVLREIRIFSGELVFDKLVYRDPVTNEYRPALASAWRWLDNLTVEMDLNTNVKFHDGKAFTADDVLYTFNYITNPANKVYAPEYSDWIARTEKIGSHVIRIHLKAPFGPAMEFISELLPILPDGFYGPGGAAGKGDRPFVGTGPYRVVEFRPGQQVIYKRNSEYWANSTKGIPQIENMVFRNLPDQATQIAELLRGEIDWIWRVPKDVAPRIARSPNLATTSGGSMRAYFLRIRTNGSGTAEPFKDMRVRQAVSHAINRDSIASAIMGDDAKRLNVMCIRTQVGCPDESRAMIYDFDLAKASDLLKDAGYPNGISTTLFTYERPLHRPIVEAIQSDLRAAGIAVEIGVAPTVPFYERLARGEFAMTGASRTGRSMTSSAIRCQR